MLATTNDKARNPQKSMAYYTNELWILLTSSTYTKTSQMEAFTFNTHIPQINPHFTPNSNSRSLAFLILNSTCLFLSSSATKNSLLEMLISRWTNKQRQLIY